MLHVYSFPINHSVSTIYLLKHMREYKSLLNLDYKKVFEK